MTKPALIWIVDDSPTQRAITECALGVQHRYEHFTDGLTFIERLNREARLPDVVLLDWVMPGLSGDEVCRFVRASPKTRDLPLVILTASRTATQDIVLALESGANDYVTKPFVREELRARLRTIITAAELRLKADRERRRVTTINGLARALFTTGNVVEAILDELATALVESLCDGCAIEFRNGNSPAQTAHRHRSDRAPDVAPDLDTSDAVVVVPLRVRGFADGIVTLTRDGGSEPFEKDDLAALATCVDLAGLAIEAALRAEADRLATRFHQELIGIVSHDLRTPLGAMMAGTDLLRDAVAHDEPSMRVLGRIENSARRMTAIVTQLLDLTRSRIGQGIQVEPQPTSLRAVVNEVLDEQRLVSKATTFEVHGDDLEGMWDPDRLAQVIANLTSNAVHYGRAGATVAITLSRESETAIIVVHNELRGDPISQIKLQAAFDPFTRGDTGEHHTGLGLGLYIVSEIVRAHGGTITAHSGADGTDFRVDLPLAMYSPASLAEA